MAASKAKGKLVSIVINNEYIKICEITKSGKNSVVHKTVTIPAPEDCYVDGVIEQTDVLAKAIKVVMDEHRFNANNVAFSISSPRLATKEVLIPNVKANKIDKLVQANATEYLRRTKLKELLMRTHQSISLLIWMSISFSTRFLRK